MLQQLREQREPVGCTFQPKQWHFSSEKLWIWSHSWMHDTPWTIKVCNNTVSRGAVSVSIQTVEVKKYLTDAFVPRKQDPLTYWDEWRVVYPHLYMLAKVCRVNRLLPKLWRSILRKAADSAPKLHYKKLCKNKVQCTYKCEGIFCISHLQVFFGISQVLQCIGKGGKSKSKRSHYKSFRLYLHFGAFTTEICHISVVNI